MDYSKIQVAENVAILPKGFLAGGIQAGIRKTKKDIAIIYSQVPATASAVYTKNIVQAAPIVVCKKQMQSTQKISAIVINSGNANACTGEIGLRDAWQMVETTANALNVLRNQVVVSSTGVIGMFLPMEKINTAIQKLSKELSVNGIDDAVESIMTTDLFPKKVTTTLMIDDSVITICGIAKGSGMIAPNMATMLGYILTDVSISTELLQEMLSVVTKRSFNRITVDGDQSTNDTVIMLANGEAKNKIISEKNKSYELLQAAVEQTAIALSKMIARDGEGASKFIEIQVCNAKSENDAEQIARSIANSNLVKTAMYGNDANWGRILCAMGYSGVNFNPDNVEIFLNDEPVLKKNYEIVLNEERAKVALSKKDVIIKVTIEEGRECATFWTCDFTEKYISINASYRS